MTPSTMPGGLPRVSRLLSKSYKIFPDGMNMTSIHLSKCLCMSIWVLHSLELGVKLPWAVFDTSFCGHRYSLLLGRYIREELLLHRKVAHFALGDTPNGFPQQCYHCKLTVSLSANSKQLVPLLLCRHLVASRFLTWAVPGLRRSHRFLSPKPGLFLPLYT